MPKPYTIATPRYRIEGVKGEYYDVFNKRANAIKAAISMAVEYPGATFLVVKHVFHKTKVIFKIKIDSQFEFEDLQNVCNGMIDTYQKKLDKTKFWRKSDG